MSKHPLQTMPIGTTVELLDEVTLKPLIRVTTCHPYQKLRDGKWKVRVSTVGEVALGQLTIIKINTPKENINEVQQDL